MYIYLQKIYFDASFGIKESEYCNKYTCGNINQDLQHTWMHEINRFHTLPKIYSGWTKKSGPPIIIRLLCIKDKKFQNNSEIYTVPSR